MSVVLLATITESSVVHSHHFLFGERAVLSEGHEVLTHLMNWDVSKFSHISYGPLFAL